MFEPYQRHPALYSLHGVFLDDSSVLRVVVIYREVRIMLLAVLLSSHPQFEAPPKNQVWCYKRAELFFGDVASVSWTGQDMTSATTVDETGEEDIGTIDGVEYENETFRLRGDFGVIEIESSAPIFRLLE
ncbi:MAG: hypothetical protein ACR2J4_06665 [Deinococcus sp.]